MLKARKISEHCFKDLEIYTYAETLINSNMYVMFCGNEGLIIDPIANDQVLDMMYDRQMQLLKIVLTHEHYDHISGVNYFKSHFPCEVICSRLCAEALPNPRKNLSRYYNLVLQAHIGESIISEDRFTAPFSCNADLTYKNKCEFTLGNHVVKAMAFGGHSPGSSIYLLDSLMAFTGDNLIPEENTILTLPGSSIEQYELSVKPFIISLGNDCRVFPGHGIPMMLKDVLKDHPDYND